MTPRKIYIPSKNCYAFNVNSLEVSEMPGCSGNYSFKATIDAIWTKTIKGRTFVSMGTLFGTFKEYVNFDKFLENVDMRYGGNPVAKWDGEYLWAPETPFKKMIQYSEKLDEMLKVIPDVPLGYEGWYQL